MAYGTHGVLDTQAAARTTIKNYGEERAFDDITRMLDAHNMVMNDMVMELAEPTTDALRRYGSSATITMQELDEFGAPDAQKITAGYNVGFPLRRYGTAVQWTHDYFENRTVAELQATMDAVTTADYRAREYEIKRSIFNSANNTSYVDGLVDGLTIPLRAFLNADSTAVPPDPWGSAFNSATHTHYIATAALVAADLTALIALVLEHYNTGRVRVYISQASETAVRALTGFVAYIDPRIIPATTGAVGRTTLDLLNVYNRPIGVFGAAEIWVKPYMPINYMFAFNADQRKPLAWRTRDGGSGDLGIRAEYDAYPLRARYLDATFGAGVQERANGAVLFTAGASYIIPAFTL